MIVLVMGVSGCGKTTAGRAIAEELGLPFYDADDFHPAANREKMGRNEPLGDEDRWPWLRLLAERMREWDARGGAVLACSALKQSYRDVLATGADRVAVVHLIAPKSVVAARLESRKGTHVIVRDYDRFLEGQFRDLEEPADAIRVPCDAPLATIRATVRRALAEGKTTGDAPNERNNA
ncbi:MAG: gluconokinase [Candidatus Sumerlaeota bacterium]|nr:gluconokinase [Candidatus Sumerlaeota bacterium]